MSKIEEIKYFNCTCWVCCNDKSYFKTVADNAGLTEIFYSHHCKEETSMGLFNDDELKALKSIIQ